MAAYSGNKYSDGKPPITGSRKGEVIAVTSYYSHPSASTKLTDGDIISLAVIPAGHEIVDFTVFLGNLDSGTALVISAGLMDAGDSALDTAMLTLSTIGQAGGLAGPDETVAFTTAAATTDKVFAVEVTTTATGAGDDAQPIGATILYAPV